MNFKSPIILGSESPRRRALLSWITSDFQAESIEVNEEYPEHLPCYAVAPYLAKKKAAAYRELFKNKLIITADTTVIVDNTILGKPESYDHGFAMLKSLSGRSHSVNTSVQVSSKKEDKTISEFTTVYFPKLEDDLITDYLNRFHPFDKAGAYGIQECTKDATTLYSDEELSFLAKSGQKKYANSQGELKPSFIISTIEGSFFNVVGFPIVKVAKVLSEFL
ncbi:MAG: Maf family protein [Bacteroidota bacterium]